MKRILLLISSFLLVLTLCGCGSSVASSTTESGSTNNTTTKTNGSSTSRTTGTTSSDLELIDMDKWSYESSSDVYYQVSISYCSSPLDESYENLAIFVPGDYFNGTKNSDGTYSCTINESATINGYSASTAPILFPVNTAGHKAQSPVTSFAKKCTTYTSEGYIYVHAGCRGKDAGVPAGVTDLKAAIRYIRYNEELLPGSTDRIVVYGHSGGGSQSAVLAATGDSSLYTPYLESIGAANTSDAVNAAMCWCPITGFDSADLGHEWMMGATRSNLSDEMQGYSDALAAAYADYVNNIGFVDEDGNALTLIESSDGIYQAGTYYEYVKEVIEESLEHYLEDEDMSSSEITSYIASLNSDTTWVSYNSSSKEVTITSIEEFAKHCKKASKPIAAFDKLEDGGHELFNTGDGECTHFDSVLYEIIKGSSYESDFASDLSSLDYLGNTIQYRLNMFSPLYYLMEANEGYQTASVAENWRIRTGIEQSDTPLTTEINLALALNAYGVNVDFETVWEQGHTQAEREGSGIDNFVSWLESLYK
ncbi:MAG: tannase [Gammaproteobacteria bacterium]|nr:tannase [Gammaproteobacteria bacterium]